MEQSIREAFAAEQRGAVGVELPPSAVLTESPDAPQPRVVGSPLPLGGAGAPPPSQSQGDPRRLAAVPPPGRTLANPPAVKAGHPSSLQRAVNMMRVALPFVQRILPLLDGNLATTVSNILTPPPPPPPPPAPKLDLTPIQKGLGELQTQHRELREQFAEHNSSLKRVEDQLEMVREATDRNTLEQQELLEDLKAVGSKVNLVALIAIGLLAFSILVNLLLYMHLQRVLP